MRLRYWHVVLGVFFLGWVFMYADRTVLSPVLATIGDEWHLSRQQLGLISSLFFLVYAAMQIPTGLLADRYGRKILLVPGFVLFGATTALSAFAPSYGAFLLLAALTGLGESTYYATQFSLSSEVIPQRFRGLGSAIINSGQAFGISLGLIVASLIAFTFQAGWRAPFAVLGVATMVVGALIWLLVRERPHGQTESHRIGAAQQQQPAARLLSRDLLLIYAVGFCSLYGFFVILSWLPYYLQVARGVPASTTGLVSSLVPWASIPGALLVSYLSDRLRRRRLFMLVMLPLAALALFAIPFSQNTAQLFAALIAYGLVGKLALDPLLVAYVADRVPKSAYSRAYATLNFSGMLSSIAAPYVTGFLADRFGTLTTGFYLAVALLVVGTVCVALTSREDAVASQVIPATANPD